MKRRTHGNRLRTALGVCLVALCPASAIASSITGAISTSSGKDTDPAEVAVWLHTTGAGTVPTTKATLFQKNFEFLPPLLVITAGQTVEMPNGDNVAHNVFSRSETRRFNLGIYSKGQSKEVTFAEPGIVEIRCSMHRRMKATIVVSPSPFHTVGQTGGRFEMGDVPPGTYELRAWSRDLGEYEGIVVVPEGGAAEVSVVLTRSGGK